MIVKVALVMQAATLGQQSGSLYERGHGSWIPFNLFQLVLVNFFYQGLLELQVILNNPFKAHPAHFPCSLYWRRARSHAMELLAEDKVEPFETASIDADARLATRL
jgi:hypothetical protein